jgi:hypothetical protein
MCLTSDPDRLFVSFLFRLFVLTRFGKHPDTLKILLMVLLSFAYILLVCFQKDERIWISKPRHKTKQIRICIQDMGCLMVWLSNKRCVFGGGGADKQNVCTVSLFLTCVFVFLLCPVQVSCADCHHIARIDDVIQTGTITNYYIRNSILWIDVSYVGCAFMHTLYI